MTTRSPYPDTEAAEISVPRLVLDRADERGAAVPLLGPADHGTARLLTGPGAAGTTTPLMGPAAPATVTPLLGPADRGTMVSLMDPADPRTAPDRVPRGLRSPTGTGEPGTAATTEGLSSRTRCMRDVPPVRSGIVKTSAFLRITPPLLRTADGHHRDQRWPSWVELFFDLAFAGAATQLAGTLLQHPALATLGRFSLLFVPVWWLWTQFSFFADRHESDAASFRCAYLAATVLCVCLAACCPRAMAGQADGFIVSVVGLRALQLLLYARAARHLPATRALYGRYLMCCGIAGLFWGASLPVSGQSRYVLWVAAMAADAAGELAVLTPSRWVPLNSWHLAERFQKFVLIVLGLSVAGLISAAAQRRWSVPLALVLIAAVITLATLWWAWMRAADRDALESPSDVARFAAANLPIVAGIAAASAGLHLTILAAGSKTMLPLGPRVALYGGVSICLAASALMPASKPIAQVRTVRLVTVAAVTGLVFLGAVVLPVYLVPTLALLLATGLTAEARLDARPSLTRKYTRRVERWRDLPTIPLQAADPR